MLALALLSYALQSPSIATLDALAQKRDVGGLSRFLTPESTTPINPLEVLRTNGAYETGRYGWKAVELVAPRKQRSFVILTTPLTSEDIGEMVFERVGASLNYIPEGDAMGVRPLRHTFEVSFDVAGKLVRITDRLRVQKLPGSNGFFFFRMSPYLRVQSISSGGVPLEFSQAGGVTAVKTFAGDEADLEIRYSGKVDLPQFAGSISRSEIQLTNDYWYPMIARQPAPFDLTVHIPAGWIAVGQGEKISENELGQIRTTRFKMDLPVVYYSFSAAPYAVETALKGKFRISAWSMVKPRKHLKLQTELYAPILDYYEKHFAPYPFSGYGALFTELYGGGALEAYSFATYGFGVPYEDAHEPAHTWWGGLINNTYLKSLWNESFAVFCEGLYARNVAIGSRQERSTAFIQDASPDQAYLVATCEEASPWVGPAAASIGYGKGAAVLQMLESQIGRDRLLASFRKWLADQGRGKVGEWAGFETAVNETIQGDLTWFFDQWIRRKGWANFEVEGVQWKAGRLTGNVKFSGQPYKIQCELLLQYQDGHREFTSFDTLQQRAGGGYAFSIPVKVRPMLVVVDPWLRVLRKIRPDERPVELRGLLPRFRRFTDPKHRDWLPNVAEVNLDALPADLSNVLIVGSPESLPAMAPLCAKAGFVVKANKLTYDGTTIDLNAGGALAIIDLPGGKRCAIGLGKTLLEPNFGRARLVLFDNYGRFLRGVTEPKTSGWMTFRLDSTGARPNVRDHPIG